MAKIEEWTPDQWKWDEEKIREYMKKFEEYINTEEGINTQSVLEKKKDNVKNWLEDEKSIDKLTIEELSKLFKETDAYNINKKAQSEIEGNEEYVKNFKTWLKELIRQDPTTSIPKGPENIGIGYSSEFLTLRYPENFYLINNKSKEGIKALGSGKLPPRNEKYYPKWRPLFEYLKTQINEIIQKSFNRPADFYDVDFFLWYVSDKIEKEKDTEQPNRKVESSQINKSNQSEKQLSLTDWFEANGFYFDKKQVAAFYSALKTKGFVILSGLSGTGKTKLAQLFAELLCPYENRHFGEQDNQNEQNKECKCTHIFLSVRPDWRDGKGLLGYYNPITKEYESSSLLKFILEAINDFQKNKEKADPYFILLDEMNLAHVEYYFADFLSVLESGKASENNYYTRESIKLHNNNNQAHNNNNQEVPKEIQLPPNLIGSVNIDETTYMFSPKVLDRAFTLEFREVDFESYLSYEIDQEDQKKAKQVRDSIRNKLLEDLRNEKNNKARFCRVVADKTEIKEALEMIKEMEIESGKTIFEELNELNQILQPYDLHFGYRVLDEIALFIKYATEAPDVVGSLSKEDSLDFAVLMKVLPKFHGPRQKLDFPLWLALDWCLKNPVNHKSTEFKFDDFKQQVWKVLRDEEKIPSIADLTHLMQEFQSNKKSDGSFQESNPQSQPTNQVAVVEKFKYPRTAKKVLTMLKQLYEIGFASFA